MNAGMPSLSKSLRFLILASVGVWVVQIIPGIGRWVTDWFALVPSLAVGHGQLWRFFTYLFVHDPHGPMHLLFNMLALWMFGVELEEFWGTRRFVIFYFLCGAGSGLLSIFLWNTYIIGASGAILGLLTVYACYFPDRTILMFFIFPMPVRLAVVVIGAISLWGASSGVGGIAYLTHLGGIIIGLLYYKWYVPLFSWTEGLSLPTGKKPVILPFRPKEDPRTPQRVFADEIDPILKKISERGMESLTKEEKKKLEEAAKKKKD